MKKSIIILCALFFSGTIIFGQEKFLTVAEKSDFKSTSDFGDVITFIGQLKEYSPFIRVETIATSIEGLDIPLLIIGNPLPKSPADLTNDKRVVIYVQANIHGGEVEGKEAVLMYARDLLKNTNPELLRDIVLLICPLINPDGNQKISTLNRTTQNGPVNGVGVRYNGQMLDLNRDAMKAESPEIKGVIKNVFNRWDPSVFMDCHTTDGSFHVEPVTFTWMVNPNGNTSLIYYMRDRMIPEISKTLINKYNVENCLYGEFFDMMDPERGWFLEGFEPRYLVNYYGIRNRLAILNENYIYADFRSRVLGCYSLIQSLVNYSSTHKSEIKNLLKEVDDKTIARGLNPAVTDSFAIEYKVRPTPEKVIVKTFEADQVTDANGRKSYKKSNRQKTVTIPYYIDYYPSKSVNLPFAYILTINDPEVVDILKTHGLKLEKLKSDSRLEVERFEITGLKSVAKLNQGHYTDTISGRYIKESINFSSNTIIIRTAQPLANVAAYLLEPQSNDGLVTWNFFDRYLVPQWGNGYNPFPVYKIMDKIDLNTLQLN